MSPPTAPPAAPPATPAAPPATPPVADPLSSIKQQLSKLQGSIKSIQQLPEEKKEPEAPNPARSPDPLNVDRPPGLPKTHAVRSPQPASPKTEPRKEQPRNDNPRDNKVRTSNPLSHFFQRGNRFEPRFKVRVKSISQNVTKQNLEKLFGAFGAQNIVLLGHP